MIWLPNILLITPNKNKRKSSHTWITIAYTFISTVVVVTCILQQLPIQTIQDATYLVGLCAFCIWMLVVHKNDTLYRTIPTKTTIYIIFLLVMTTLLSGNTILAPAVASVLFGILGLTVVVLTKERYLGMGDVHVLVVIPLVLGPHLMLICLLIAAYLSCVRFIAQRNNVLPFGADLAFGAVVILLLGDLLEPWLTFMH